MKITTETITPAKAKTYLGHNLANRNVRRSHVLFLANEMTAGRWKETHEGIGFFEDGDLADGQHRLHALIESGTSQKMLVVRGLSKDAMSGIDVGAKRSIGDYLHLHHGVANSNLTAAAARGVLSFHFWFQNWTVSADIVLKVLATYGPQIDSVIRQLRGFNHASKAWIVATLAIGLRTEPTLTDFIHILATGENGTKGSPALSFRNWLISNNSPHLKGSYKSGAFETLANAMLNHVQGNPVTRTVRGATGVAHFRAKERRFIESMRDEITRLKPAKPKKTA